MANHYQEVRNGTEWMVGILANIFTFFQDPEVDYHDLGKLPELFKLASFLLVWLPITALPSSLPQSKDDVCKSFIPKESLCSTALWLHRLVNGGK